MSQVLGEHVCGVIISVDIENLDVLPLDDFANVVIANVNVLGTTLSHLIGCHEDGALTISADWDSAEVVADLAK